MSEKIWQLIVNNNLQNDTAENIHVALTTRDIEVRTPFFLTCNQLNLMLPFAEAQAFATTLAGLAAADPWFARLQDTLCGTGVDLSLDKSQALLDQFASAGYFDAGLCATLKTLGLHKISKLEEAGLTNDVTVEQIASVVTVRGAIKSLRDQVNTVVGRLDALETSWAKGETVTVPTFAELVA